jgi:hypothetical protein
MNPAASTGVPETITLTQHLLPLAASLLITIVTVELIRRRKLREEYAMLWLAASAVLLVFAVFPRLLWHLAHGLGVYYLTVMVLLAFSFLALLVIHLAVVISRLADDSRQIAQRLALAEQRLLELQKQEPPKP